MSNPTISVSGTLYDKVTGLPVTDAHASPTPKTQSAVNDDTPRPEIKKRRPTRTISQITHKRSSSVARFTPRTSPRPHQSPRLISDIGPTPHPATKKVETKLTANSSAKPAHKPAAVIKQEAIQEALDKAPLHENIDSVKTPRKIPRLAGAMLIAALCVLVTAVAYINLPRLTVYVAAARSGVEVKYPSYQPDGYRLSGVTYDDNLVAMDFSANGGPRGYQISQKHTSWDSTAVNENYVKTKWGNDAVTHLERGLTIYIYGNNAVWVNGGILYEITGSAPLGSERVHRIAASL